MFLEFNFTIKNIWDGNLMWIFMFSLRSHRALAGRQTDRRTETGRLREDPVTATWTIPSHWSIKAHFLFLLLFLFPHFHSGSTHEAVFMGAHIWTQLEGIMNKKHIYIFMASIQVWPPYPILLIRLNCVSPHGLALTHTQNTSPKSKPWAKAFHK